MIAPNAIERDLLLKFMESAQTILPGITLRYTEKYQYDQDNFLRIGLDLPQEINSDSPDIEKIQRVASSLPLSPTYQLSIAFTEASDKEHELALDFLPDRFLSPKSKASESKSSSDVFKGLWRNIVNRLRRIGVIPLLALVVLGFLLWNSTIGGMKYLDEQDAVIESMRNEPAQKRLQTAAREFHSALEEYRDVIYGKSDKLNKKQISDTADHLYDYIKRVEQDSFFNIHDDNK